jgi:hypothetical protein
MLNFTDGDLAVARRLKETERFQAAHPVGDGLPDFPHIAARGGHDAKPGNDWVTRGH